MWMKKFILGMDRWGVLKKNYSGHAVCMCVSDVLYACFLKAVPFGRVKLTNKCAGTEIIREKRQCACV